MKNLLIIAAISLGTMVPGFAQQPVLRSYDELHQAQQKDIMRTWNVVDTPQPFLSSGSYDELREAQQNKIVRTWNAIEVVRATSAPGVPGATKDYLDQNTEQINMNAAINSAIEF
jgi:hypothetical protein